MPYTVLFLFFPELLDVVLAIRRAHSFSSVLKVMQSFVIVSDRSHQCVEFFCILGGLNVLYSSKLIFCG